MLKYSNAYHVETSCFCLQTAFMFKNRLFKDLWRFLKVYYSNATVVSRKTNWHDTQILRKKTPRSVKKDLKTTETIWRRFSRTSESWDHSAKSLNNQKQKNVPSVKALQKNPASAEAQTYEKCYPMLAWVHVKSATWKVRVIFWFSLNWRSNDGYERTKWGDAVRSTRPKLIRVTF